MKRRNALKLLAKATESMVDWHDDEDARLSLFYVMQHLTDHPRDLSYRKTRKEIKSICKKAQKRYKKLTTTKAKVLSESTNPMKYRVEIGGEARTFTGFRHYRCPETVLEHECLVLVECAAAEVDVYVIDWGIEALRELEHKYMFTERCGFDPALDVFPVEFWEKNPKCIILGTKFVSQTTAEEFMAKRLNATPEQVADAARAGEEVQAAHKSM